MPTVLHLGWVIHTDSGSRGFFISIVRRETAQQRGSELYFGARLSGLKLSLSISLLRDLKQVINLPVTQLLYQQNGRDCITYLSRVVAWFK